MTRTHTVIVRSPPHTCHNLLTLARTYSLVTPPDTHTRCPSHAATHSHTDYCGGSSICQNRLSCKSTISPFWSLFAFVCVCVCVCLCVYVCVCVHLGQLTPQKRMGGVYGCGYSGNKREERRCRVHVHRCYVIFVLLGLGLHTCV